jgi:hypothetical protein
MKMGKAKLENYIMLQWHTDIYIFKTYNYHDAEYHK